MRSKLTPMHETFDFPDPRQIKGQREVTTVAPQALFFMNGEMAVALSHSAAERLLSQTYKDDAARVQAAYLRVLGRKADADEVKDALGMMKVLEGDGAKNAALFRWAAFVQALMTSAEFRYVL
jgi:hypothetical protein